MQETREPPPCARLRIPEIVFSFFVPSHRRSRLCIQLFNFSMASQRPGECGGLHCAGVSDKIWYCVDCGCWLCAPCWGNYPPHTGGRKGRDGLEHEKTKYKVYRKLEDILTPTPSQTEIEEHHSRDLDSTWFGTYLITPNVISGRNSHVLQAFGKTAMGAHYSQIMMCTPC